MLGHHPRFGSLARFHSKRPRSLAISSPTLPLPIAPYPGTSTAHVKVCRQLGCGRSKPYGSWKRHRDAYPYSRAINGCDGGSRAVVDGKCHSSPLVISPMSTYGCCRKTAQRTHLCVRLPSLTRFVLRSQRRGPHLAQKIIPVPAKTKHLTRLSTSYIE